MASSSRLVTNAASPDISLPLQRAVVPRVEEPDHQNREKDDHLDETRAAQRAIHDGPRVEEHELHVEQDEENRGQVEPDRQAADWQRERNLPALERLRFHGRRLLRTEHGCQDDVCRRERTRQNKSDNAARILTHRKPPLALPTLPT